MTSTTTLLDLAPGTLLDELTRPWAPERGSSILVAVSGGADSVALFSLLAALAPGRGWSLAAATLDHGLRGDEGARDRRFVESLAAGAGVPVIADRRAPARRAGASPEEAARDVRRAFLLEARREAGADAVALAHTADDQAETVLFRLGRGAGTAGLGAMPRWRPPLWRPLLGVRRAGLRELLSRAGLEWREDETNATRAPARNRIRHDLLPAVESVLGPGAVAAIARGARLAQDDEALLSELSRRELAGLVLRRGDSEIDLDRRGLARLPDALARRVVRLALESVGCGGRRLLAAHLVSAVELARAASPGTRIDLPAGASVARRGAALAITRPSRGEREPGT